MQSTQKSCTDCEQYLADRLSQSWQARSVDRAALAKTLILSSRQLDALLVADSAAFHTYGIYLRAIRRALEEAGIASEPEVAACLDTLVHAYSQEPGVSQILAVRKTINQKLGVAPHDEGPPKPIDVRGVVALIGLAMVVLVLSLYLTSAY